MLLSGPKPRNQNLLDKIAIYEAEQDKVMAERQKIKFGGRNHRLGLND